MEKRIVELIIACHQLAWGLWMCLLMSPAQFASPTFAGMAQVAPQQAWSLLFIFGGASLLLSVVRNNSCYRRWALAYATLSWFALWMALVLSNYRSAATVTYLWSFLLCVYAYLRAGRDVVNSGRA